jgi:DNA-directed RNA polymerase subunit omega
VSGTIAAPEGITNPPIDELLEATGSKYSLVIYAAKRARQINAYYSQLGEGLLEYVGRSSRRTSTRSRCPSRCARSTRGCCPPSRSTPPDLPRFPAPMTDPETAAPAGAVLGVDVVSRRGSFWGSVAA